MITPHPDDEALACGIVLQRAVRAGAAVRIVYATDGDDNPWPQRVLERTWRLGETDRKRWGKLRRAEALTALHILGVCPEDVRFLVLPDQRLTHLLVTCWRSSLDHLAASICDWSPTHLLVPSLHDTHPDHNALAVMLPPLRLKSREDLYTRVPAHVCSQLATSLTPKFSRFIAIYGSTTASGALEVKG